MPTRPKFRALAFVAAFALAACTTQTPGKAEPLTPEAAAEAMFAEALARPEAPSAAFDAEGLKALLGDGVAITWSASDADAASGAWRLADVRVDLTGEKPYTVLTADEVLLWNADIGAIEDRIAGQRLGETLRVFDRIEMSGVSFDLDDYMNTVQDMTEAALPDAASAPVAYSDSAMTVGRIVFEGLTLHPWTFQKNEDGDSAIEAIRLISAIARSVSLDSSVFIDSTISQKMTEAGLEGHVDQTYARQILKGYDRGNIAAMITTGTQFTAAIPVPDEVITEADEALPTTYRTIDMSGSYGFSSWSGFEFANLLAWGEKGELPPITERDLISIGTSSITDMKFDFGGQPVFRAAKMDFEMDKFSWFLPERIVFSHEDAAFDLVGFLKFAQSVEPDATPKDGEPSIAEIIGVLERSGLGTLSGDGTLSLTWDSETGATALENSGVTDNIFGGLTRLDLVLPSYNDLVPAFKADGVTPDDAAFEELITSKLAFSGARYSVTDLGGLNALATLVIEVAKLEGNDEPMMGNFAESTPADVRSFASGLLLLGGGAMTSEVPQASKWIASLSKFVTDGGTIEFVAAPAKPLTLADLTGMTPDAGMAESPSPEEIVELLGVQVTHTPPDAE